LLAEYDDPDIYVLSLLSAVLRVFGNIVKLLKIKGGKHMEKVKIFINNTIKRMLTNVVETLLVVGNLGGNILLPLLAMKDWVDFPLPRTSI
jgi:hypothetical protein